MQVDIRHQDRSMFTLAEGDLLPAINQKIKDDYVIDYVQMALRVIDMVDADVLRTVAYLARNERAANVFFTGSMNLDVWIEAYAIDRAQTRFVRIGFYLSDIWNLCSDNQDEFRKKMFILEYLPKEAQQ